VVLHQLRLIGGLNNRHTAVVLGCNANVGHFLRRIVPVGEFFLEMQHLTDLDKKLVAVPNWRVKEQKGVSAKDVNKFKHFYPLVALWD